MATGTELLEAGFGQFDEAVEIAPAVGRVAMLAERGQNLGLTVGDAQLPRTSLIGHVPIVPAPGPDGAMKPCTDLDKTRTQTRYDG